MLDVGCWVDVVGEEKEEDVVVQYLSSSGSTVRITKVQ